MEENINISTGVEDISKETEHFDASVSFEDAKGQEKETFSTSENEIFNYKNYFLSPEEKEKKEIKKVTLITLIPLIITYILSIVISKGWSGLYNFLPNFGIDTSVMATTEMKDVLQIFYSIMLFTFPFIIPLKLSGKTISKTIPFNKPNENSVILPYFLIGLSFCEFANIAVSYAGNIFKSFGVDYSVKFSDNGKTFFGVILSILATAIVPALVEEFALRGVVLGSLLPYGEGFACMVSAILFGVMHGNFEQMPFAFLVGLVLGIIRIKTGTMWICILVHFANNFTSVLVDYLSDNIPIDMKNLYYTVYLALWLLLGIVGVAMLCKKTNQKELFSLKNDDSMCKTSDKYKWYFISVPGIMFLVLYFIRSLRFLKF